MIAFWQERIRPLAQYLLVALLALTTFAFLTAGMSERQGGADASTKSDPVTADKAVEERISEPNQLEDPVFEQLQTLWQAELAEQGLRAAPPADWLTVCRRISLGLVGAGMSLEEIRDLEKWPAEQRVHRHLQGLLSDGRFHDYWAERFTRFLVGADEGPFLVYRRRRFRTWLSDQLASNRPYDDLVRKLVTAEGLWTDRPEVNFLTVTYDSGDGQPDPIRMAARTSRAFLGVRIDCLQCHDDFLGNVSMGDPEWMQGDDDFRDGRQQDFHQLAAFFTAAKGQGLQGVREGEADYQYQYLDATEETPVDPEFPFLKHLDPKLENDSIATRQRLALWLTDPENKQFARAAVARVWTLLFGQAPQAMAVDDLPLDQPPSPMIRLLADEFAKQGFDLRKLITWIVTSPAFNVDSRADFEVTTRHEWVGASFPIVRLRAEQVAVAAIQAGRIKTIDRESALFTKLQLFGGTNDFLKRYGDRGEDEFTNDTVTVTQRLTMLNGKLVKEVSNYNPVLNTSAHVNMFATDDGKVVETLYLANLNRYPTDRERQHFVERLEAAENRQQVVEDIVWALLNSSEFAWNH